MISSVVSMCWWKFSERIRKCINYPYYNRSSFEFNCVVVQMFACLVDGLYKYAACDFRISSLAF